MFFSLFLLLSITTRPTAGKLDSTSSLLQMHDNNTRTTVTYCNSHPIPPHQRCDECASNANKNDHRIQFSWYPQSKILCRSKLMLIVFFCPRSRPALQHLPCHFTTKSSSHHQYSDHLVSHRWAKYSPPITKLAHCDTNPKHPKYCEVRLKTIPMAPRLSYSTIMNKQ